MSSPAEIWTKAIELTLRALREDHGDRGVVLRDLVDEFDRERDHEIVAAELAKARTAPEPRP